MLWYSYSLCCQIGGKIATLGCCKNYDLGVHLLLFLISSLQTYTFQVKNNHKSSNWYMEIRDVKRPTLTQGPSDKKNLCIKFISVVWILTLINTGKLSCVIIADQHLPSQENNKIIKLISLTIWTPCACYISKAVLIDNTTMHSYLDHRLCATWSNNMSSAVIGNDKLEGSEAPKGREEGVPEVYASAQWQCLNQENR